MNETNKDKKPDNSGLKPKPGKPKFSWYWIYAILAIAIIGLQFMNWGTPAENIGWGKVKQMLTDQDIDRIVLVNREFAEIYIKKEKLSQEKYKELESSDGIGGPTPNYIYNIGSIETFEKDVNEIQEGMDHPVYIKNETRRNVWGDALGWIFPIILLVGAWFFIMRMMSRGGGGGGGQIFNIGKSKAQLFDKDTHVNVNFNDVAGLEEAKVEIMEIVDFLKNPTKYTTLGGKIPKGALLVGPPGTGKTLLAKAVAGEADVPFFSMSGSDFVEMFVGVGASRVRDLFRQAKEKSPCIIFIDEIDAVGRARGKNPNMGSNDERENTLNQLLTEMDGFGSNSGVIILAATNRADILDKALLRAGRFDRQIHVDLPDVHERKQIFNVHLRPIKINETVDVNFLAKQTPGFSGADIANVCNEAALIAARKGKSFVEKQDFLDAVDRIVGGLEKKSKIITQSEKRSIAFHEAGHATISWMLEHANPLVKVTIVPRGEALGAAWYLPEERQLTVREHLLDEMCATLGGRAAEEVFLHQSSTGAINDLERVTKRAYAMVAYFGMSEKLPNVSYYDSSGNSDYGFTKPYSEKTAELIDSEAKLLVAEQYARAKQILTDNAEGHARLSALLLEKEVIFSEDLEEIFGKRPWATRHDELILQNGEEDDDTPALAEAVAAELPELTASASETNEDTNDQKDEKPTS